MVNFDGMLRAVLVMRHQRLRFETRAVKRQRPGFAHAAHIGQGLFNDNPADALLIKDFKHQIEIAVADLLRADQFVGRAESAKLLRISHRIAGRKGSVLRHC